jgi:predicted RNA binding protein YcfA (HicA-like mRNA interferase family)
MSPKRKPMKPREIVRMLRDEGWDVKRRGPGDHVQYAHPTKPGKVTVDMGVEEFPTKTLKSIFTQAGWGW